MSELINDLVDKTAAMVPGVYTVEYESGKKGVEFNEEALNRFVELIVRECIHVNKQAILSLKDPELDIRATTLNLVWLTSRNEVEKHFEIDSELTISELKNDF